MRAIHKIMMTASFLTLMIPVSASAETYVTTTTTRPYATAPYVTRYDSGPYVTRSYDAAPRVVAPYPGTTVTTTAAAPVLRPGVVYYDLATLDRNRDRVVSAAELSEDLFYLFDTDGNEVIDNIEYEQSRVYTMTPTAEPMQRETIVSTDFNNDGIIDSTRYTTDQFLQTSRLNLFGPDARVSPHEFLRQSFLETDDNDDKAIRLTEWQNAYIPTLTYASAGIMEDMRYNH